MITKGQKFFSAEAPAYGLMTAKHVGAWDTKSGKVPFVSAYSTLGTSDLSYFKPELCTPVENCMTDKWTGQPVNPYI